MKYEELAAQAAAAEEEHGFWASIEPECKLREAIDHAIQGLGLKDQMAQVIEKLNECGSLLQQAGEKHRAGPKDHRAEARGDYVKMAKDASDYAEFLLEEACRAAVNAEEKMLVQDLFDSATDAAAKSKLFAQAAICLLPTG